MNTLMEFFVSAVLLLGTLLWLAIGLIGLGALVFLVARGIRRLPEKRRRRLIRDGICLACDYRVGGLPRCPECGRPADPPPPDAIVY